MKTCEAHLASPRSVRFDTAEPGVSSGNRVRVAENALYGTGRVLKSDMGLAIKSFVRQKDSVW